MIITFIGHRFVYEYDKLCDMVEKCILKNAEHENSISFYCGGYGSFDNLCAKVCSKIKQKLKNCEIVFVTPYITISYQKNTELLLKEKIYTSVIYPPLEKTPAKFAIVKRNRWMIEEADLVIAYVNKTFGGAYSSLSYAKRKNKRIINLADASL